MKNFHFEIWRIFSLKDGRIKWNLKGWGRRSILWEKNDRKDQKNKCDITFKLYNQGAINEIMTQSM